MSAFVFGSPEDINRTNFQNIVILINLDNGQSNSLKQMAKPVHSITFSFPKISRLILILSSYLLSWASKQLLFKKHSHKIYELIFFFPNKATHPAQWNPLDWNMLTMLSDQHTIHHKASHNVIFPIPHLLYLCLVGIVSSKLYLRCLQFMWP
jgi:hypothetical protein